MKMGQKRTYIRLRNIEFAPVGPLVLGSLLTKPREPNSFVPGYSTISPSASDIQRREQCEWIDDDTQGHKVECSIYATFLEPLFGRIDVSLNRNTTRKISAKVARLETNLFIPTEDYLQGVLSCAAVQMFLSTNRFRTNLYLVTGVKIAYGSVIANLDENSFGVKAGVVSRGSMASMPTQSGLGFTQTSAQLMSNSHQEASDHVYAYQVKEVHYCRRRSQVIPRDINGGALYNFEEVSAERSGSVAGKQGVGESADFAILDRVGNGWLTAKNMRTDFQLGIDDNGKECEIVDSI